MTLPCRPYFANSRIYGGGPLLEETRAQTLSSARSPQQVIDRTLRFREDFDDYRRQFFNVDGLGIPLDVFLWQMEILAGDVVPAQRKEFGALRPGHVPDGPISASLKAENLAKRVMNDANVRVAAQ